MDKTNGCPVPLYKTALFFIAVISSDKLLTLDTLLIQIRSQVTPKWYKFGIAIGLNQETINQLSNFPSEERIVEMLDLWLRTNGTTVTWRDVANALKDTGLYLLAEKILKVYKTGTTYIRYFKQIKIINTIAGKLPTTIDENHDISHQQDSEDLMPYSVIADDVASAGQSSGSCPPLTTTKGMSVYP